MFLVSRVHNIPYHDTTAITRRVVNEVSNDTIVNTMIEENHEDYRAVMQQQRQLRIGTAFEALQQTTAILNARIKDIKESTDD